MMKDTIVSKILNAIHIIFFTSILCFGITFLSAGLLIIPAFTAAFMMGKTIIYKEFDITDSVIGNYLSYFKEAMPLMKYVLLSIILLLNLGGMMIAVRIGMSGYAIICLCIMALVLTMILYLAAYYTFYDKELTLTEVAVSMIYKPAFLVAIFCSMVLLMFFSSLMIAVVFVFAGTVVLYLLELMTFLHMLHYKKLNGRLEDEKFARLVMEKEKK